MNFIYCFESEWLKKKRSLASWLVIVGACFTPFIIIIAKLVHSKMLATAATSQTYWEDLWKGSWESMAIFLLPMGAILATSLVVQLEYKNNTWKQLHTMPQKLTTIFFAKLSVIVVMMLQFFLLFNVAVYISGMLPYIIMGYKLPAEAVPLAYFLREDGIYFISCLPIVALQYLVSIQFKNFLIPVGGGFLLWVGALAVLSWKYGYIIPYTYCSAHYMDVSGKIHPNIPVQFMAIGYFMVFVAAGYVLYLNKKEKG